MVARRVAYKCASSLVLLGSGKLIYKRAVWGKGEWKTTMHKHPLDPLGEKSYGCYIIHC